MIKEIVRVIKEERERKRVEKLLVKSPLNYILLQKFINAVQPNVVIEIRTTEGNLITIRRERQQLNNNNELSYYKIGEV